MRMAHDRPRAEDDRTDSTPPAAAAAAYAAPHRQRGRGTRHRPRAGARIPPGRGIARPRAPPALGRDRALHRERPRRHRRAARPRRHRRLVPHAGGGIRHPVRGRSVAGADSAEPPCAHPPPGGVRQPVAAAPHFRGRTGGAPAGQCRPGAQGPRGRRPPCDGAAAAGCAGERCAPAARATIPPGRCSRTGCPSARRTSPAARCRSGCAARRPGCR